MNNLHVKTGDNVMIISGKDKGHTGKVLQVSPSENKVIVEGQNMVTKHVKPRRMGETGGIVKAEGAMYACKVQIVGHKGVHGNIDDLLQRSADDVQFMPGLVREADLFLGDLLRRLGNVGGVVGNSFKIRQGVEEF